MSLPESPTGLYWSIRGHVACPHHAPQVEESRWACEGWLPIPSRSQGFRGMTYQCQSCSPDHTAVVQSGSLPPHSPAT